MHRALSRVFVLAVGALVLVGCGGGTGGGGDNGGGGGGGTVGAARLGIVDFAEVVNRAFGDTVDVDLEASFFATSAAFVEAYVALEPEIPIGTCEVVTLTLDWDDDFALPEIPGEVSATLTSVNAGPAVNVRAGSDVYTTAERFEVFFGGQTFFAYDNGEDFDDDVSAPAFPAGALTLVIPGAAGGFPSMTVGVPSVRAMVLTTPVLTGDLSPAILVGTATTFEWEPREAGEPASYVRIFAAPALPMVGSKFVECNVPDTGTFAFSAETQIELGAEFSGTLWDFARVVRHVHVDASSGGTVVLNVERGVSSLGGLGF